MINSRISVGLAEARSQNFRVKITLSKPEKRVQQAAASMLFKKKKNQVSPPGQTSHTRHNGSGFMIATEQQCTQTINEIRRRQTSHARHNGPNLKSTT